jgi:hypothetical protein
MLPVQNLSATGGIMVRIKLHFQEEAEVFINDLTCNMDLKIIC